MTGSADRGLRPDRVAEIIVALPDPGPGRRGSGYLVSPGKVLTAAHVVEGAARVRVRFQADLPGERTVEAVVQWQHRAIDVAVLTLEAAPTMDAVPVTFGRVGERDAVLPCTALGFPRFKLRTDEDGSRFRDAEHVHAICAVLSNRREGTLDLTIASPPADDPDPDRDAWEGMSGAAVFSNGRLVGIVRRHHRSDGPGRIAAIRVDRWAKSLSTAELVGLEGALGCVLDPDALPDVIPATALDLIQEVYRAQLVDDFAPTELEDRESELRNLVEFCSGSAQYLRLQGRPWAGKTSLAAWFALNPPRGVVPVWFFITARNARQSDSDAFTGAIVDQLAAIAGREPTGYDSPSVRGAMRSLLLREAAQRVAQHGGVLLLIVDGLDEDQSLTLGGCGPSVASLLPERPPPNVRVLVTSRPNPDLPEDVKDGHPLRHCQVLNLTATAAARHIEYAAKHDLRQALSGDRLQIDLVGLLTAARGTLRVDDLRELTGAQHHELTRRLGSAFGRILRERGAGADSGGDVTLYVFGRGYLFAHETLLAAAQEVLGRDVGVYWERLHGWAEIYRREGWPEHTPLYLLQPYGRLVAFQHDPRRAVELATDVRRRDRLREVTGSDAACLAEIAAARQLVQRAAPDDLGALAALAAAADLVARRNEALHPDIPAVYARLGRDRHAIGLARSVFRSMDRARALTGVAGILAGRGDQRAVGLAEEAVWLTERAVAEGQVHRDYEIPAARGRVATVLALLGREDEALKRLAELPAPEFDKDVEVLVEAYVATAGALEQSASAVGLLRQAEEVVESLMHLPTRIRAMAAIAQAWAAAGDPGNAACVYDSVVAITHHHPDELRALAAAQEAVRGIRPREVERIAQLAVTHAERLSGLDHREDVFDLYYEVAEGALALIVANQVDDAHSLMEAVREARAREVPGMGTDIWQAIAERRAREGRAADAWAAFEAAWETGETPVEIDHPAAAVVALLAESGAADELETLLLGATNSPQWAVAEALAALADYFVDEDADRSLRLLEQAEHGHRSRDGAVPPAQPERLAALAGALAKAGLADDAERLVRVLGRGGTRAWGYALVGVSLGHTDRHRAVRLAGQAVDEALATHIALVDTGTLTMAVQALASAGATDRVTWMVEHRLRGLRDQLTGYDHYLVCLVAADGLWPHDPETAGQLVDALPSDQHTATVRGLAELLAVVGLHDEAGGSRVLKTLSGISAERDTQLSFHDEVLMSLLTAIEDPIVARQRFDRAVSKDRKGWPSRPGTVEALVYAVLGDHEAAQGIARSRATEEARSETFADLAAYLGCVPGVPKHTPSFERVSTNLPTVCRVVSNLLPPTTGPDLPRARALLAEALTADGWHHAAPVLAAIDPDAVRRTRDVVFAHLGLRE